MRRTKDFLVGDALRVLQQRDTRRGLDDPVLTIGMPGGDWRGRADAGVAAAVRGVVVVEELRRRCLLEGFTRRRRGKQKTVSSDWRWAWELSQGRRRGTCGLVYRTTHCC